MFDTDGPVQPSAAGATPMGRGVLIKWSVPAAPQDFTPNDPLDVKGNRTQKYVPMIGRPGLMAKVIGPATTSTRQVIKSIKPPYVFQLRTGNKWSTRLGGQVLGLTSSINAAVPGSRSSAFRSGSAGGSSCSRSSASRRPSARRSGRLRPVCRWRC